MCRPLPQSGRIPSAHTELMDLCFSHTPQMYGMFHLTMLGVTFIMALLTWRKSSGLSEDKLVRIIGICGLGLCVAEIWKQQFCLFLYDGKYVFAYFPFQLCSLSMYVSVIFPFVSVRIKRILASFQSTYLMIAGILALLYPEDMLRPQVLLTMHGFLYHTVMIILSLLSLRYMTKAGGDIRGAGILFILSAGIAYLLNVFMHHLDPAQYTYFFYISPYFENTQPVFSLISHHIGITAGNLFYLLCIILSASLLHTWYVHRLSVPKV